MRALRVFLLLLCAASLPPAVLQAQSTEDALKARLLHKPLYLRGMWKGDTLKFDTAGKLKQDGAVTSFTLAGVEIGKVQAKHGQLHLEGRRVGLEFVDDRQVWVPLKTEAKGKEADEKVTLDVDMPGTEDYGAALDAIFATDLSEMAPLLPAEWQDYAQKHLLRNGSASTTPIRGTGDPADRLSAMTERLPSGVYRLTDGMTVPTIVKQIEPDFTPSARTLRYAGNVIVYLRVETDGRPSHLHLVKPLGLGLDEGALDAVQQWLFAPARLDGKPVTVEMQIEVNFEVYYPKTKKSMPGFSGQ